MVYLQTACMPHNPSQEAPPPNKNCTSTSNFPSFFSGCDKLQTTLVEEKEVKMEYDLDLHCTRCSMNVNEDLPSVWRFGRLRPLLQKVTVNILICPRCKTQYYRRGFFGKGSRRGRRLERCSHCGSRRFRFDRKRRELYCVKCGLVKDTEATPEDSAGNTDVHCSDVAKQYKTV